MTGAHAEAHEKSDQAMFVVSGRMKGTAGSASIHLETGDSVVIRAGTPHHFSNDGEVPAVTFNVYSPPEYPEDEKG